MASPKRNASIVAINFMKNYEYVLNIVIIKKKKSKNMIIKSPHRNSD